MDEQRIPPRPTISRAVALPLNRLNAAFDWLFHSEYNPFYRSGTLAIGLLFVLLGTGFYLLFFYNVAAPYQSVVEIQQQVWVGRWMRALHRYATDAALIAVVFHVLQLLAQGKTWGPRTLAWISGVVLAIGLFVSAWTGYVMVWDQHGQRFALAGLAMLRAVPLLGAEMSHAFSGLEPVPASFFFMNLFLHVAIPLGMVFGMWIHTAKLARTVWLPMRSVFWGSLLGLFALSVIVPSALTEQADLLRIQGRIPFDWWYGFWIPWLEVLSPQRVLLGFVLFFGAALSVPWWWRPARVLEPPISAVDEDGCTGCTQCARDCPYEAISMTPHPNGKHLLAEVSPANCVSCGICAASCADFAVGPPERNARDQLARIQEFCATNLAESAATSVVVIGCSHNDSVPSYLEQHAAGQPGVHYFGLNCCGTLHSKSLETFLDHTAGLLLVGCAARNCMNRDGLTLLFGRIYGKSVPFLAKEIARSRIVVSSHSEREKAEICEKIDSLCRQVAGQAGKPPALSRAVTRAGYVLKRSVATVVLLGAVALLNQAPVGQNPTHARIRVTGNLPGQVDLGCRPLTAAEKQELPRHMQREQICEQRPIHYTLRVAVDSVEVVNTPLAGRSLRGELPVLVHQEVDLEPGERNLRVQIVSTVDGESHQTLSLERSASLTVGKIELISVDEEQISLLETPTKENSL